MTLERTGGGERASSLKSLTHGFRTKLVRHKAGVVFFLWRTNELASPANVTQARPTGSLGFLPSGRH